VNVELVAVEEADKPVLANLLQLYLHDFSAHRGFELSEHGTFNYRWLDSYFTEGDERAAYLIRCGGRIAGFAMVSVDAEDAEDERAWDVKEFFVVRAHRRQGVAQAAARLLWEGRPGMWTLRFDQGNPAAAGLWPGLVRSVASGPVERSEQQRPEVAVPRVRLRFRVAAPDLA
jgi:predicted acetyltransferase